MSFMFEGFGRVKYTMLSGHAEMVSKNRTRMSHTGRDRRISEWKQAAINNAAISQCRVLSDTPEHAYEGSIKHHCLRGCFLADSVLMSAEPWLVSSRRFEHGRGRRRE